MDNLLNFIKSKKFVVVISVLFGLALLAGVFGLGVAVGYYKARFSYSWGENYHKNFGGPMGGFMQNFSGREFIDAHGVAGQIIKIDGATLVLKGKDNVEKIVVLGEDTSIRLFRGLAKLADLKIGEDVIVIGEPNASGQIEAKFVRVVPTPSPSMLR